MGPHAPEKPQLPPGPRGFSALKTLRQLIANPLPLFNDLHQRFGDTVGMRAGTDKFVFLYHPDDVERVLVKNGNEFIKGKPIQSVRLLSGNGLFVSEGEHYLRQRRRIQPVFQPRNLEQHVGVIAERAAQVMDNWSASESTVDVEELMSELAVTITADTMFGSGLEDSEVAEAIEIIGGMSSLFPYTLHPLMPLLRALRTGPARRFTVGKRNVDNFVERLIARQQASIESGDSLTRKCLLRDLINSRASAEDTTGMTHQQIVDEVITLLFAGFETMSSTFTWTLYFLAKNPNVRHALESEAFDVLGDKPLSEITLDDVKRLRYTAAVFQETMRICPAGSATAREATTEVELRDVTLGAGWQVLIPQWTIHNDSRWWERPENYDPERFLNEDRSRPRFAYFPFGGGKRVCIGSALALLEGTIVLAQLARTWKFELPHDAVEVEPVSVFTVRPKGGMPLEMSRIKS